MPARLRALLTDAAGTTAIEYALIATLIGIGTMGALQVLFNDSVGDLYSGTMNRVMNALGY